MATSDEGLDGALNQDAVGLDRISVQANGTPPAKTVIAPESRAS